MRRSPALLLLVAPLLLAAPSSGEQLLFHGTLTLRGFDDPAPIATANGVATVNGAAAAGGRVTSLRIPGGLFSIQSTSTPATPTNFTKLIVSATPGSGTFTTSGGGPLAGVLPVPGNVRVCLFASCGLFVDVPFTENGTRGVGIGGTVTNTLLGTGTLSIQGSPFAAVTAALTGTTGVVTSPGFAHGPASLTSSTAQTGGVVQLVSPVPIAFTLGADPPLILPTFTTLRIEFLPEPGVFTLLLAGAAGVTLLGRRRRRQPRSVR